MLSTDQISFEMGLVLTAVGAVDAKASFAALFLLMLREIHTLERIIPC